MVEATLPAEVKNKPSSVQTLADKPDWWKWTIVLTACLGAVMEIIDTSIVNVALPHIQATMGVTVSEVAWTITGYAMANVIMIPLSAWLGDVFGKKNYFIFCLIGFTLSSVLCGMATSLPMLVVSRILQGVTGGGLLAKGQGILFETFSEAKQRATAQAIFGMGVMIGPALGPVLGGYLTDTMGWRWIFFINIPVGILATLCAFTFFIQDKQPGLAAIKRKVDWWGIFLLTLGLGSLQVVLEEGHREEWFQSPFIVAMSVLTILGLVLFIWQEWTIDDPAVNIKVLKHKSLAAGSVFSVVLGVGLYGSVFAIPIFAQTLLNYTATQTGLLMLPTALASAAFMVVSSILAQKFDVRLVVLTGALILSASMFQLAHINPNTSADALFWPNIFRGIGTVLMFLPLTMASLSDIPPKEIHAATGFFNLTRQIGGSFGIAALTTLLDQRQSGHRSMLAEHVSQYDPLSRQLISAYSHGAFAGSDPTVAHGQALTLLSRQLDINALLLSYGDIFWVVGMLFIVACPLIFLLGKGNSSANLKEVH